MSERPNEPQFVTCPCQVCSGKIQFAASDFGQGGDNYWIRIASAWAHADGNGFNIQLETVPLDGRVALRIATEKNK